MNNCIQLGPTIGPARTRPARQASGTLATKAGTRHVMRWLAQLAGDPCLTAGLTVRVCIVLTQYYNHHEGCARPSQATLAARLRCSRNGVALALKRLAKAGHIEVVPGRGPGSGNRYVLRRNGETWAR